jgi:hypothetical protein
LEVHFSDGKMERMKFEEELVKIEEDDVNLVIEQFQLISL